MALSEREQEVLAQLEQQLSDDPQFASQMEIQEGSSARKLSTRNIVLGVLIAVVGLVVLLTGVTINQIWVGVLGFVMMAGGVFFTTLRGKTEKANASDSTGQSKKSSSKQSSGFMSGLEERWEQRRNQQP
ncbi:MULTISPECIES: DUF3040 domain-containing protein [Auritidibacter]|uniref:DUF3040 domain-containing protein n=1 Tax=Auritidibacter ignavus TaxID=678932 RepID=A0AAJ6APY5_9MICC|nr:MULTISPECIES: DUF3040 domain-containing protein [Auritidibacter]PXA79621.1 hypothetical protein DCC26_05315 [Auritidibacter sp. NML120779]AXR75047.1 DUF3040 domain-containing protein [Auritidibacter sp. NML130574]NIH70360.1 hypothetical protein [Auritidibacter ignavus]PXA76430.1 hypothetical protein DCC24_07580 [Auritidibacter sp. NML100628]PXA81568.1 hypothetical protein DCC25_02035 [Auritidibacter sp. NML120636]